MKGQICLCQDSIKIEASRPGTDLQPPNFKIQRRPSFLKWARPSNTHLVLQKVSQAITGIGTAVVVLQRKRACQANSRHVHHFEISHCPRYQSTCPQLLTPLINDQTSTGSRAPRRQGEGHPQDVDGNDCGEFPQLKPGCIQKASAHLKHSSDGSLTFTISTNSSLCVVCVMKGLSPKR